MNDLVASAVDIAKSLGLRAAEGDLFIGRRGGFPIGLKLIGSADSLLLLFQIRHPLSGDASELKNIRYDSKVSQLITEKALEIDFDNRLIWLSFASAERHLADGSFPRLLDSVLESFARAGLLRDPELCHYCNREKVKAPICVDGKAVQICDSCLKERAEAPEAQPSQPTEGATAVAALATVAILPGALGWALFWMGYDLLFDVLNAKVMFVPRLAEIVVLVGVAAVTGGPAGLLIRRGRRRGRQLSITFAVCCAVAAVGIGEIAYVAWLIYREFKVFSLQAAWDILPKLELEMGGFHLAVKLIAAVCAVVLAVELAKPLKRNLKL